MNTYKSYKTYIKVHKGLALTQLLKLNIWLYKSTLSFPEPEEEKEPSPVKLSDDPLNWFGLMAPTSLVQAQTRFKSAIERIVEISNLKQELTESLTEFESLSDNFQKKCSVETNEDWSDF